jgi:hypothetical protein
VARFRGRQDPELGHVRHADDDQSRVPEPADDERVVVRPVPVQEGGAHVLDQPAHGRVRLDRDRHAGERPRIAGGDPAGGGTGAFGVHVDERVEHRVELSDSLERGVDELEGRDFAIPDERGELVHGPEEELACLGHAPSLRQRKVRPVRR